MAAKKNSKSSSGKKAAAKKPAKKATAKKSSAKKAPAKKSVAKKAPAQQVPSVIASVPESSQPTTSVDLPAALSKASRRVTDGFKKFGKWLDNR